MMHGHLMCFAHYLFHSVNPIAMRDCWRSNTVTLLLSSESELNPIFFQWHVSQHVDFRTWISFYLISQYTKKYCTLLKAIDTNAGGFGTRRCFKKLRIRTEIHVCKSGTQLWLWTDTLNLLHEKCVLRIARKTFFISNCEHHLLKIIDCDWSHVFLQQIFSRNWAQSEQLHKAFLFESTVRSEYLL